MTTVDDYNQVTRHGRSFIDRVDLERLHAFVEALMLERGEYPSILFGPHIEPNTYSVYTCTVYRYAVVIEFHSGLPSQMIELEEFAKQYGFSLYIRKDEMIFSPLPEIVTQSELERRKL